MFWHRFKQLKTWFSKGKHQLTWLQAALLAPPTINPCPLHLNSQVWKCCFSIYKWINLPLLIHLLASSCTKQPQTRQVFPDMNSSGVYWCSARTLPVRDHYGCSTSVLWLFDRSHHQPVKWKKKNNPGAVFKHFKTAWRYLQSKGTIINWCLVHQYGQEFSDHFIFTGKCWSGEFLKEWNSPMPKVELWTKWVQVFYNLFGNLSNLGALSNLV